MSARSLTIAQRLPLAIIVPASLAAILTGAHEALNAGLLGQAVQTFLRKVREG